VEALQKEHHRFDRRRSDPLGHAHAEESESGRSQASKQKNRSLAKIFIACPFDFSGLRDN
jgi:hypothetical protein